jgi:hypothetical protein
MATLFLFTWLSLGCVVQQYGGGSTDAVAAAGTVQAPVDFSGVETRLEEMIAAETDNVDRRDRLEAAWELCQKAKTTRPASQHVVLRYLRRLVEVEERSEDAATDAIANPDQQDFVPIAAITAEEIAPTVVASAPAGRRRSIVPPDSGAAAVMASAREHMGTGDLVFALEQLEVCDGQPCSAAVVTLKREVQDRWVYRERAVAADRFVEAKKVTSLAKRRVDLQAVADHLKDIEKRFPDSRYQEGVASSLVAVRSALTEETN